MNQPRQKLQRIIFIAHGVVTFAAAVVLAVVPGVIPQTVGISLRAGDELLSHVLAGAELAIALISLGAARLSDRAAIRLIAGSFAAFHFGTAILEAVVLTRSGMQPVLLANIVIRVVVGAVFVVLWWRRRA